MAKIPDTCLNEPWEIPNFSLGGSTLKWSRIQNDFRTPNVPQQGDAAQ